MAQPLGAVVHPLRTNSAPAISFRIVKLLEFLEAFVDFVPLLHPGIQNRATDLPVLSSPFCKNKSLPFSINYDYRNYIPARCKGRIAIVTRRGARDVVDARRRSAMIARTNAGFADGQAVWS
jgi:hypothetical protein